MMILLNTWCVLTAHPYTTLVTALNELEEGLLLSSVRTKLLRAILQESAAKLEMKNFNPPFMFFCVEVGYLGG